MPKGPLKTPFTDYVVPKGGPGSDMEVYLLDQPSGGPELVIGVKSPAGGDLLDDMGK